MERVILIGAEEIRTAASSMQQAAHTIHGAAGLLEESLAQHRAFLDDWLLRLEHLLTTVGERSR